MSKRRLVVFLLGCGICGCILFAIVLAALTDGEALPTVCLIGVAPHREDAERVFLMWEARFLGVFYLWNASTAGSRDLSGLVTLPMGQQRLSRAERIEQALNSARSSGYSCSYFFEHDSHLYLSGFQSPNARPADIVLGLLREHRPLLASFPLDVPLKTDGSENMGISREGNAVSPMLAFVSGAVLYHASVVDFFIPYPHSSHASLCSSKNHFLELFSALSFFNDSMCIRRISYRSNASLCHSFCSGETGDETESSALRRYLMRGVKQLNYDISENDLNEWHPVPRYSFPSKYAILRRVAQHYHLEHDALRQNRLLLTLSGNEVRRLKLSIPYSLRINVFAFRTLSSFRRLWKSLSVAIRLLKCLCSVDVHVFQDHDPDLSPEWREQRNVLLGAQLDGVSFAPHLYASHQGMKKIVMSAWHPQTDDEFGLFLEESTEVADIDLQYLDALIRQYWYAQKTPLNLLGVSLFRPLCSEETQRFCSLEANLFLYGSPISSGMVFAARPWQKFLVWEGSQNNSSLLLPNSYTNLWPAAFWKKALLRWMALTGTVLLHPSTLFGQSSQAASRREIRVRNSNDALLPQTSASFGMQWREQLPSVGTIPQVDAWGKLVPRVTPQTVTAFDACTVIMAVCARVHSWKDRVLHFRNATFVRAFIVLWQNCEGQNGPPSETPDVPFDVRVLSMRRNSLNNRFMPISNLSTDCIISVDDDFDMPLGNISFAVRTWQGHFWNHAVGFAGFGRNHFWDNATSSWRYSTSSRAAFSSIVLPTCLIYHRKYQELYAKLPVTVLNYVDEVLNCDDILLNFLISNVTKSGPVVIAGDLSPTYVREVEKKGGLWHRPTHFPTRSTCLNVFAKLFEGMPLRYTTKYFDVNGRYGSSEEPPGLWHHESREEAPLRAP